MFDENFGWHGYSDAKPSESIQKHELPGLAVAVVFPYKPGEQVIQFPIRQYKDYKPKQRAGKARHLAEWLTAQKELGLILMGFMHAHTQVAAATLGLELIEELPNTRVEHHHDTYRLFFKDKFIDFAQAVALEYYFLTISFGVLPTLKHIPREHRKFFVAMDRFPGADTNEAKPGEYIPPTQGIDFIKFIQTCSKTGMGIEENNRSKDLVMNFGTIDWWKWEGQDTFNAGKSHPHFVLPDWIVSAVIAHNYYDKFVRTFENNERIGIETADALIELYNVFKTFDFWSMDENILPHIRAAEKLWEVPVNAREYILARAENSN